MAFFACVLQFALIGAMFAWAYAPIAFGVEAIPKAMILEIYLLEILCG